MLVNHKVKMILAVLGVLLITSCSGPEAKKMKFFGKGKDLGLRARLRPWCELRHRRRSDLRFRRNAASSRKSRPSRR